MALTGPFSAAAAEAAIRRMCADHDLREPDEIQPRQAGGITCIWYEEKLVLSVEDEERRSGEPPRCVSRDAGLLGALMTYDSRLAAGAAAHRLPVVGPA